MTSIYNNISDFIIILNLEGEIKFCNKSCLNKLHYKEEEIIKGNICKIVKQKHYFHKVNEGENLNEVIELYSKNKEIIKIDATISIENFKNEKSIFILGKETPKYMSNYDKSIFSIINENNMDYNEGLYEVLKKISSKIFNFTKVDGLSLLLYNKNENCLEPFIKLDSENKIFKNVKSISLENINRDLLQLTEYSNHILFEEKIKEVVEYEYINIENVKYSSNYMIDLNKEFMGVICLNYNENNSISFNCDEYMKYICNQIAMVIKNVRLSNQVISENKKRKYSEKELERYLEISVDMIAMLGKDGKIKVVSSNWKNLLGWSEDELLNKKMENIIHHDDIDKYRSTLKELDQEVIRKVIRFRNKDGYYSYLEWSCGYFADEQIYITTARDITEKLAKEQEKRILEETIKLQIERNEFFSNISHEFRTPINIILGTTQVIKKNLEQDKLDKKSLEKYINYIKQNSYRLLRLVNNSIDVSKMDAGAYELRCSNENIINIIEEITLSVADFTKDNNINLIFDTEVEEVITYCDADKIERIMLNLLSNAIKYTHKDGVIKVNISTEQDKVIVSIKDNGIGIPQEKQSYIFDRFGQLDGSLNRLCEGSGIGLSIVKKLVQMHGGQIYLNSEINEGSEFIFTIPIKVKQENSFIGYDTGHDTERKSKHVERCEIEFSHIYE